MDKTKAGQEAGAPRTPERCECGAYTLDAVPPAHICDDLDDQDDGYCMDCGGTGERNMCWDDMCAGQDECLHGDGMVTCVACRGTGYPRPAPKQPPARPPTPDGSASMAGKEK